MTTQRELFLLRRAAAFLVLMGAIAPVTLAAPANYYTITPCRVFDTRQPADGPPLAAGVVRTIDVAGRCGIPADARAVVFNLTVTQPTSFGHLRLSEEGTTPPTSTVNFRADQTRANNALTRLSAGGQVDALAIMTTAPAGTVHLIVDAYGYFVDDVPPVGVDDAATVTEDAAATTLDVLANDTNPEGGPISIAAVTQPANGTVTIGPGGANLTYQPSADYCNAPPPSALDTFTYDLAPGTSSATVTVTVNCVNDPAQLAGAGTVSFTEDGPPVVVAPLLSVTDVDDTNLESATVAIANLLDTGTEVLAANTAGTAISATYVAPTLTLTGPDTLANYQQVLRSVTYANSDGDPDLTARTVIFAANDGDANSNPEPATVTLTAANDAPVLAAGGGTPAFTEDGPPVVVDAGLTATDADDVNLESAAVTITNLLDAGVEVLAANTAGTAITATYVAPTLTLTGPDTLANYQQVLRSVTYENTSDSPTATPRVLAFLTTDGVASSNTVTTTLGVTAINDAPVLTAGGGSPTYTEDAPAVAVDPALTVTDGDSTDLASAVVTITNLVNTGSEILAANVAGTFITATYVAPTLTLTGTDTLANYQQVLRSVTYRNNSQNPSTAGRVISFRANDGTDNSNIVNTTVGVTAVNDAPVLAGTGTVSFTEDGGAVTVAGAITVADADHTSLSSGQVRIANLADSGMEVLTANVAGTFITANYIAPTLTLSGTDTLANYQQVLRSVAYNNSSQNPNGTARILAFVVSDGVANSNTAVATVTVTPVNDPPVFTNPITYATAGHTQLHVAGDTLAGVASIADPQSAPAKSAPTDVDGPAAPSVVAASGTTANGGTYTIDANGSFTYMPALNFTGTDPIPYQITDGIAQVNGTINVTVSSVIWYVRDVVDADNAAGGDGRSTNAFETLAAAQAASRDNHVIFVFTGNSVTTPYTPGILLQDGQKLHGQGVGLSVPGFANIVAAGTQPRVNGTTNAVSVFATTGARNNVEIRGLDLQGGATGNAVDVTASGANVVGVTISDNTVRGAGAEGIDLNASSTVFTATVQNNTIAATGNGFDVRHSSGTLQLAFNANTVVSNGTAVLIDGRFGPANTATITAFADNTVNGNTLGGGINVNRVTFDATPGGSFDTISAGNTQIGASGNGVGGPGLVLTLTDGDLSFTDLDIHADGGAGLLASGPAPYTGSAGLRITVPAFMSTVTAVGGPAVDLTYVTASLPFQQISSTNSATAGVSLYLVPGTFTAGPGSTITNATGTDFVVNGRDATVTYEGTITDDDGQLVQVISTNGGIKTFSGAITDGNDGDGGGVSVTGNTGATVRFTGGLVLSTGGNPAFAAIGGGTVEVCDENPCNPGATGLLVNTLATTTGTALNVTNTNIGTNGLEFRSISANGGVNGVFLAGTGAAGGLQVKGSGGSCSSAVSCSGGAIQNTSSDGVRLINTLNVSLTRMFIFSSAGNNIDAASVTNLTLTNLWVDSSNDHGVRGNNLTNLTISGGTYHRGGANAEPVCNLHGVEITNLLGTNSVTGATFSRSNTIQFHVVNFTATNAVPGTPDTITISGVTGSGHNGPCGGDHFSFAADTGGNFKVISDGSVGENNFGAPSGNGGGIGIQSVAQGSGFMQASITALETNHNTAGAVFAASANASIRFRLFGNKSANGTGFADTGSLAVAVTCTTSGTCEGEIDDNTITHSAGTGTNAMQIVNQGTGTTTVRVSNNVVTGNFQRGLEANQGAAVGVLNLHVNDNSFTGTGAGGLQGMNFGTSLSGDNSQVNTMCLNVLDNTVAMAGGVTAYRVTNRLNDVFRLQNFTGTGTVLADIQAWFTATKSNLGTPIAATMTAAYQTSPACPTPTLPTP